LKSLDTIDCQGQPLETLCGMQRLDGAVPADARVLATFSDKSPALLAKPLGKGQLLFCGSFPGLGYQRSGVLAAQAYNKACTAAKQQPITYNPPSYTAGYRTLLATALDGLKPPVMTDNYLVEADLLEHANGLVITLSNWSGQSVKKLKVSLPLPTAKGYGKPYAAIGAIATQQQKDGQLILTLDLQEADFIVIPYKK